MALNRMRIMVLVITAAWGAASTQAQNPCAVPARRALVLSGGGVKGAFEVGALAHLIIDRGCDFQEISGISVGGLNAASLAQARSDSDPAASRAEMAKQAEALAQLWLSIRGSRDIYRPYRFAILQVGVGTKDSFNDFKPLSRLIRDNISVDRLRSGRTLRVGVVAVREVKYREVVSEGSATPSNFLDYVCAGAVIPIVGHPPRILETGGTIQYGDASLRHITPILSYFRLCTAGDSVQQSSDDVTRFAPCDDQRVPPHNPVEQLWVLLTSPYTPGIDTLPQVESARNRDAGKTGLMNQVSTFVGTLNDNTYRTELDQALLANNMLAWQDAAAHNVPALPFYLDSYNSGLPYHMTVIAPEVEKVDFRSSLDFSPARIRQLLHDGCVEADKMMHERYHLESMIDACKRRFPVADSGASSQELAGVKLSREK